MRNLKIWSRALTSSEIRYAEPSMTTGKEFGSGQMSTTSSCGISDDSINEISDQHDKVVSSSMKIFSNTYNK
jgi:hypothetical protein